jgi:hypothetical protein
VYHLNRLNIANKVRCLVQVYAMTIFCKLVFAFQGRTHYLNLYVQLCKEAEHPKNLFLLCVWHLQAAAQGISTDVPICMRNY